MSQPLTPASVSILFYSLEVDGYKLSHRRPPLQISFSQSTLHSTWHFVPRLQKKEKEKRKNRKAQTYMALGIDFLSIPELVLALFSLSNLNQSCCYSAMPLPPLHWVTPFDLGLSLHVIPPENYL